MHKLSFQQSNYLRHCENDIIPKELIMNISTRILNHCPKFVITALCIILGISACNKQTPRYTTKTINPELIGTWQSTDNCRLTLAKKNNFLRLVAYRDNTGRHLQNLILNLKPYSIETTLSAESAAFNAEYIDGTVIIESYCNSPLKKIN